MVFIMVVHVYSIFICLYREIFEVRISTFGGIMKFLEVIGVYLYLAVFISCLTQYAFWMYDLTATSLVVFEPVKDKSALKMLVYHKPECLTNRNIIFEWSGGTLVWFILEIIVHITYVSTLVILMGKSRFISVGIDNTPQFQPTYLSFLANKIIQFIPFDFHQKYNKTRRATKRQFINRKKFIELEGIRLAMTLQEKDFDKAYRQTYFKQKNIVMPEEAEAWIFNNVYGNITPDALNDQRVHELNHMDMM